MRPQTPPEDLTFFERFGDYLTSSEFWFQTLVMVGLAPIWFPILKALYREIDRSLRDQGGIFGRTYTAVERKRLEARDDPTEEPLQSVPHGPRGARAPARSSGRTGRPLRSARPRGF